MSAFGRCEWCRGERLRASLVRDDQSGLIRCSNRAVCEADRLIRKAREAAREEADARDAAHVESARIVLEIETGERERRDAERAAKQAEHFRKLREARKEARAAKRAEREAEPKPKPKRVRRRPPKPLSPEELEARMQWLQAKADKRRREREEVTP